MERVKNVALVFCLFIVLLVIFSSYFRANEVGAFFGALAGTPLLVHVFNRVAPSRRGRGWRCEKKMQFCARMTKCPTTVWAIGRLLPDGA